MNKYEFITQLDEYLKGHVSEQDRMECVQYYRQYIEEELSFGKTETEILDGLGSPGSIGRSIVEAQGGSSGRETGYQEYGYDQGGSETGEQSHQVRKIEVGGWKSWLIIGGIILFVLFILSLVFRIIAVLIPFLVPVLIVIFVINLFKGRR